MLKEVLLLCESEVKSSQENKVSQKLQQPANLDAVNLLTWVIILGLSFNSIIFTIKNDKIFHN